MKKLILFLVCCSFGLSIYSGNMTFADVKPYDTENACEVAGFDDPLICGTKGGNEQKELQHRVKNILEVVYLWIGIIAVIFIVVGGIRYMTSAGDTNKLTLAKNTITYSIVGLIVTLAAFAITEFVIGALDGRDSASGSSSATSSEIDSDEVRQLNVISTISLVEGNAKQLKVTFVPDYAKERAVSFSSKDPSIAEVTENGLIRAIKAGKTTIISTAKNGVEAQTAVTVIKPIPVEKVELKPTRFDLKVGKTKTIVATIVPKNAANKSLRWTSSNPKIAIVSTKGTVKGLKEGNVTITTEAHNGVKAVAQVSVGDKLTGGEAIAQSAVKMAYTVGPQESRKMVPWPSTKLTDGKAKTYIEARDSKALNIGDHNVAGEQGHFYASCDMAVAVTVRYSGVDKNFEYNGTPNIFRYFDGSGKSRWNLIGTFDRSSHISSIGNLQPGDVLIAGQPHGHIFVYVGNKAVKKKYPNSNADSLEAGYGSVEYASYYPHLFNLIEDSKQRTINNMTYKVFRSVDWDKRKFEVK